MKVSLLLLTISLTTSPVFGHENLRTGGNLGDVHATATDISESDLIATAGTFGGTVDFGGLSLSSTGSFPDVFLTVGRPGLPPLGTVISGVGETDAVITPIRVILQDEEAVYLIGTVEGTLEYGPGAFLSSMQIGVKNTFIVKYAIKEDGLSADWGRVFTGLDSNTPHDAAIGPSSQLWIVGEFYSTTNFAPGSAPIGNLTAAGLSDGFTAQLQLEDGSPAGTPRQIGSTGSDAITSICFDIFGGSYLGGYFQESINVDVAAANPLGDLTSTAGGTDGFVVQRNGVGGFTSVEHIYSSGEGSGYARVLSLAMRQFNDLIIAGDFRGEPLTNATNAFMLANDGSDDVFVARRADGAISHTTRIGGSSPSFANRIVANKGSIVLAGSFVGEGIFAADGDSFTREDTPGFFDGYLWTLDENLETIGFRDIHDQHIGEIRDVALKENGWVSAVGSFRQNASFNTANSESIAVTNDFSANYFQWFAYPIDLPELEIEPLGTTGVVLSFTPRCGHDYVFEKSPDLSTWSNSGSTFTGGTSDLHTLKEFPPSGPTMQFFRLHVLSTTEKLALP